jgi:hypothetical protein
MPFCRANTLPAFAKRQERIQIRNKRSITMRRDNQIWLTGAIVAVIGFGSIVVIYQRGQIAQQQRVLDQQALQAKALQQRSDEADQLRKQESSFTLQLRALDAEQANQALSAQRSLERQQLIGQIQDLRTQRAQLVRQANCNQTQMGIKAAERSGDSVQAKALQERWNANCAS